MNDIKKIYKILYREYDSQKWWPIFNDKKRIFEYKIDTPINEKECFEIIIGTILTQNTSWTNVEKAIDNLIKNNVLDAEKIIKINKNKLASLIKSSGYYNQKAERLKVIARFFLNNKDPNREELLNLKGVGKETADSILLYAYNKPYFVVDAYTKRIMNRIGFKENDYDKLQELFYKNLERDYRLFNEFHALLVRLAKENCKKTPVCINCCLKEKCRFKNKSI